MKNMGRRAAAAAVVCALLLMSMVQPICAAVENGTACEITSNSVEGWPQMSEMSSETAVLMEAETGAVLVDKGMTEARYPASITKVLTCLIAIENCKLSEEVTFTEEGLARITEGTSIDTQLGEVMTLRQCLNIMMIVSANEVAAQVAIHVAGSESAFAEMMNEKVQELGGVNSNFTNASGLPDENHYTCAYDMALVMREALQSKKFVKIISRTNYTLKATNMHTESRTYSTHVPLISPGTAEYYEYCIGGKTGYTNDAWNTLISASEKDGMTLVAVTMRADTLAKCCADSTAMYEYGFNDFARTEVDGGCVILPDGVTFDELTVDAQEQDGEISSTYYYGDTLVGVSTVQEEEEAVQETESGEDTDAETVTEDTSADTDIQTSNLMLEHRGFAAIVGGLCGLILLGIICIIITLITRRR